MDDCINMKPAVLCHASIALNRNNMKNMKWHQKGADSFAFVPAPIKLPCPQLRPTFERRKASRFSDRGVSNGADTDQTKQYQERSGAGISRLATE